MKLILLSALILAIGTSSVSAQVKDAKTDADGSLKVDVVNIGYVFNHYERAKVFKQELERLAAQSNYDSHGALLEVLRHLNPSRSRA
jgi:Skp family chaperone for outer membrane proteins